MLNCDLDIAKLFQEAVGLPLEKDIALKDHSTFRIGGQADFFFQAPSLESLRRAVSFAQEQGLPFYVIGAGSNILFADEGYRGLLIKNLAKGISLSLDPPEVEVSSGTRLQEVIQATQQAGLAGLEFLAGIPGTVGGAIWGNAGAFGQSIGEALVSAQIWGEGGVQSVPQEFFCFAYRSSRLKEKKHLVLSARLALERDKPELIQKRINELRALRRIKHPPEGTACAGSFFKNLLLPDGQKVAAGLLLDQAGVKGLRRGDAVVYSGHANFILNVGQAKARDVLELAREMKQRVKEKFGLELEEEVIYLEADASMLLPEPA